LIEDRSGHPKEVATSRRRLDPAARSLKDDHANRAFELTNAAAKGRLPNEQGLGRLPKAPMIR
jgi:hypothetical protein